MMLTKAALADRAEVMTLYRATAELMEARGLHQWHWGDYPTEPMLDADIADGAMYIVREDGALLCAVVINQTQDAEYDDVAWLFGTRPGLVHRLAVSAAAQGKGMARRVLAEAEDIMRAWGCDCFRCDTYSANDRALALYDHNDMRRAGTFHFPSHPLPFVCFEKPLTSDCPLLPLPMVPAFRGGALTPWGGDRLRREYGKRTPEDVTGESLEVSCLPGLESTDPMGVTLPALIARYGAAFAGDYADRPFPLLLKLLDAREPLSVQVHPDDAYAAAHEGKQGKTEAWLILDAAEGAELIYGIRPGVTREALRAACASGRAVEPLLRRVSVHPGDVCYIPAGCVHAIGGGITLYEIQQSSDVTYRFYDWDRVDAHGQRRPLHLNDALSVTDLTFSLSPIPAPDAPLTRVLDTAFFSLTLLRPAATPILLPATGKFALLTALTPGLTLSWSGGQRILAKGETLFLPAAHPPLTLIGSGRALEAEAQCASAHIRPT